MPGDTVCIFDEHRLITSTKKHPDTKGHILKARFTKLMFNSNQLGKQPYGQNCIPIPLF